MILPSKRHAARTFNSRAHRTKCSYSFWHHIKQLAVNKFYVINISLRAKDDTDGMLHRGEGKQRHRGNVKCDGVSRCRAEVKMWWRNQ